MKFDKDFRKRIGENSSNAKYCERCGMLIIARSYVYANILYLAHKENCTEGNYE